MSIFQTPPRFFLPAFPQSPDSASPLLSPRSRRSPHGARLQEAAAAASSSSPSSSLSSPLFPSVVATALIVLCLTAAVLLSLLNQQCDDMAVFSSPAVADDSRDDFIVEAATIAAADTLLELDRQQADEDRGSRAAAELTQPGGDKDAPPRRNRRRQGPEHVAEEQQAAGESGAALAAAAGCVGLCCMSLLSRVLLILAFFCNAALISLLLCVKPSQQRQQSPPLFPSSSSFHRCLSFLVLAVVHFVLTGAVTLLVLSEQSRVRNLPPLHSSLLFSSYILLMFTSFGIEALCLLSAVAAPQPAASASSPAAFSAFSFLPPDPDTERLLFHSLPTDPTQSLSSAAFAFLPSYIIPCSADAQCLCRLQRMEEGHVCKEMDEGRRSRERRRTFRGRRSWRGEEQQQQGRAGGRSRSEQRLEEGAAGEAERAEARRKREVEQTAREEAVATAQGELEAAEERQAEEEEEAESGDGGGPQQPQDDSDSDDWELERGRVETFDFERGLVVSSSVPSYSPRYGALSSSASSLAAPPLPPQPTVLSSASLPNPPVLSLLSLQASARSRSLLLPPTSPFRSQSPLPPSAPLLPPPHLPSSCSCVCAICLSRFQAHSIVKLIACQHRFHLSCLRPWAARRTTCPLCRAPLTARQEGDDRRAGRGQGRSLSFSG